MEFLSKGLHDFGMVTSHLELQLIGSKIGTLGLDDLWVPCRDRCCVWSLCCSVVVKRRPWGVLNNQLQFPVCPRACKCTCAVQNVRKKQARQEKRAGEVFNTHSASADSLLLSASKALFTLDLSLPAEILPYLFQGLKERAPSLESHLCFSQIDAVSPSSPRAACCASLVPFTGFCFTAPAQMPPHGYGLIHPIARSMTNLGLMTSP